MQSDSLVEFGGRRFLVVCGVMLATLLQTLDATIVNVALPTIDGNLGASSDEGVWVVTSYLIAAVIAIPLTPWLHARFGRKSFYVGAVLGFTAASLLCGASTSLAMLVLARTVQGLFGGGLVATAQAVLRDTFPPHELNRSQMLLALGQVAGPSLGPTLGGIFTDNASWNWVFYVNIVPGCASALLLSLFLRDAKSRNLPKSFDAIGVILLAIGLAALQYMLDQGEAYDWWSDASIVASGLIALAALPAFVVWELRGARVPIVDLSILRHRSVAAGVALATVNGFSLFSIIVLLPQYVQNRSGCERAAGLHHDDRLGFLDLCSTSGLGRIRFRTLDDAAQHRRPPRRRCIADG
jgi:DHA2 family multidrug resistance protein